MSKKLTNIIYTAILGFLACILLGVLIQGMRIFDYQSHAFQITSFGIMGSIFFSINKYGRKRELVFTGLMLFIANLVLYGKLLTFLYLIRDIGFISSLFASLILYSHFLKKYYYATMFLRALVLSLFLGILNILVTVMLIIIFNISFSEAIWEVLLNGKYGAIIGLGLGIGFDIYVKFKKHFTNLIQV